MRTFTPSYCRRNLILHLFLTTITLGLWPVMIAPFWVLFKRSRRLIIDDGTIRYQMGIFSRDLREINIRDVRSVKVKQGAISRLLGIGDIEISSASGADDQIVVRGVSNPELIRLMLRESRK